MNIYYPFNPYIRHEIFSDLDCGPRPSNYSNYQKLLITDRCLCLLRVLMVKPDRITQQGLLDKTYKRQEWLLGQTHRQISLLQYIGHIYLHLLGDPISGLKKSQQLAVKKVGYLAKLIVKILEDRSQLYLREAMREGISFENLFNRWSDINKINIY